MPRKKLEEKLSMEQLVSRYFANKKKEAEYKKVCDADNTEIKKLITSKKQYLVNDPKDTKKDHRSYTSKDGIVVDYYVRQTRSMNEEALAAFLKEKGYNTAVKTVEVVDMEEVERLIYKGIIPTEEQMEMKKFEVIKESATLTVKEAK